MNAEGVAQPFRAGLRSYNLSNGHHILDTFVGRSATNGPDATAECAILLETMNLVELGQEALRQRYPPPDAAPALLERFDRDAIVLEVEVLSTDAQRLRDPAAGQNQKFRKGPPLRRLAFGRVQEA